MLVLRFRQTFRERCAEWVMALILMGWGLQVLQPFPLFNRPFFALLASVGPEWAWGWAAFMIGIGRLIFLFINGAWRASPGLRQLGCIFGMMVWLALGIGGLSIDYGSPSWAPYFGLFVLDALSLSFAAQDGVRYRNVGAHGHGGG